jgi:large subunit ribosomal protein L3
MPKTKVPHRGSLQVWPRVRAGRAYARVRTWLPGKDAKPMGFAGYKAGMTHIIFTDNRQHSMTKGKDVSMPVTIVECPPIKVASVRF